MNSNTRQLYSYPNGQMYFIPQLIKDNHELIKALEEQIKLLIPVGTVFSFAGNTVPTGYLICDGSEINRTDYTNLFAVIGTTYGEGDGSTTFNLPNYTDKFLEGSTTAGTIKNAGLPNITGHFDGWGTAQVNHGSYGTSVTHSSNNCIGQHTTSDAQKMSFNVTSNNNRDLLVGFAFNAGKSNSIYGNSSTVQPPAITVKFIIKY